MKGVLLFCDKADILSATITPNKLNTNLRILYLYQVIKEAMEGHFMKMNMFLVNTRKLVPEFFVVAMVFCFHVVWKYKNHARYKLNLNYLIFN